MTENEKSLAGLEQLIGNNPDLEELESIVSDFNPFVAMGWTKQELRHSAFLRWFLDPRETHGLGSYPLRVFLKEVLSGENYPDGLSVVDADTWILDEAIVMSEWEKIDLFIRNDNEKVILVLENKVGSTEHSGQLQRYRKKVSELFPGYKAIYVFLTPAGVDASDDSFQPMGYSRVVDCIERVVDRRKAQMGDEVRTFLDQYIQLVRRHILEESQIQELCRRLYENHRAAFDLIYEYRPDRAQEISVLLQETINKTNGVELAKSTKSCIRFFSPALKEFPLGTDEWVPEKNLILFELLNYNGKIVLKIILGPGDSEIREKIHGEIKTKKTVFNRGHTKLPNKFWTFHRKPWFGSKVYSESTLDDLQEKFEDQFSDFVEKELPQIDACFNEIKDLL